MKELLKELKLNESTISMLLGGAVVFIAVLFIIFQFKNTAKNIDLPNPIDDININSQEASSALESNKYTVQPGDSLWSISEREYGTGYEWQKIASANPEISLQSGRIESGQVITIPSALEASPDGKILEVAAESESGLVELKPQQDVANQYIVQQGDCLWHIAQNLYGDAYRWVDIANANNLANPDIIHAGNSLLIPA